MKTLLEFVTEKHKNQIRKYTNEPYINHLVRVASNFEKDSYLYNLALCHDLFEDTDCDKECLYGFLKEHKPISIKEYHALIEGVSELTDQFTSKEYPNINRGKRKVYETNRLRSVSKEAMTVKYADLIDNCDIVEYDKEFGKIYLEEVYSILERCTQGDFDLYYKLTVKHNEMNKLLW